MPVLFPPTSGREAHGSSEGVSGRTRRARIGKFQGSSCCFSLFDFGWFRDPGVVGGLKIRV